MQRLYLSTYHSICPFLLYLFFLPPLSPASTHCCNLPYYFSLISTYWMIATLLKLHHFWWVIQLSTVCLPGMIWREMILVGIRDLSCGLRQWQGWAGCCLRRFIRTWLQSGQHMTRWTAGWVWHIGNFLFGNGYLSSRHSNMTIKEMHVTLLSCDWTISTFC